MIKPIRATGLERLELQRLRDRVGRLYAALQEATEAEDPLASGTWAPPVDLCETEKLISIRVELPGVAAEQIKIGLCNTKLRISGEKKRRPNRRKILSCVPSAALASLNASCRCVGPSASARRRRSLATVCCTFTFQRLKTEGEKRS
jgi:hypothetical protein